MTSPPYRRRLMRDRLIAAAIVVVVAITGVVLYLNSDIRAASSEPGSSQPSPTSPQSAPTSLRQAWQAETKTSLGSAISPAGVVAVADGHTVTGLDAVTGKIRWSYGRSNADLCSIGDWERDSGAWIAAIYAKNGYCSQVETFDADTGARAYTRTSPNPAGGALVTGAGYLGWLGNNLVELWRDNLIRTVQYGDQPSPTNPHTAYTGCTFGDLAVAAVQFATIEHCTNQGPNARIVLNFDDPGCNNCNYPSSWKGDVFKGRRRIDKDTGSAAALIVGISPERVAVLVAAPEPAVVVYDAAGTALRRTPVNIPAAEIVAAAGHGPTPAVVDGSRRISLVGSHLIAVDERDAQVPAPATTLVTPTSAAPSTSVEASGLETRLGVSAATSTPAPIVSVGDLNVAWSSADVLGLPAVTGGTLLVPVTAGLRTIGAADGPAADDRTISVDRGGYAGRVDAAAIGEMVIETRGSTVVGLAR